MFGSYNGSQTKSKYHHRNIKMIKKMKRTHGCKYQHCNPVLNPTIKNKLSSFKSSENIQKKKGGQTAVSNNKFSSGTLNELAMAARVGVL